EQGVRDLTGGGLIFAVEANDRAFLVVTPSDPEFLTRAHDRILEMARKNAADHDRPDPIKSDVYRGIVGYNIAPGEAHAIVDGRLVVASGSKLLKAVIDRALDRPERSILDNKDWQTRQQELTPETLAWGFARLDLLRSLDKPQFTVPEKVNPLATILFGSWIETFKRANWVSASLTWTEGRLGGELILPSPPISDAYKGYIPPESSTAPAPLNPPGMIASVGLWRDLSALWDARDALLPPEAAQGLAKLDTAAGTFFGGRDFGNGVLGPLGSDWRLIVAQQDPATLKPVPDLKLPAFALVIDMKPEHKGFVNRLQAAFQTVVGLANLSSAQTKAPPLLLGSETIDDVTINTARFLPPETAPANDEPVHQRHNFSPSTALVNDHFVLSSSLGLAKDLIKALKNPPKPADGTLVVEAEGAELANLIDRNHGRLIAQNMLKKGNDRAKAAANVDFLGQLVRTLGHARLTAQDRPDLTRFRLNFDLGALR
ncbi:MAG: hypothetical protein ABI353_22595, partial [Isosphaeraceae bacterium]